MKFFEKVKTALTSEKAKDIYKRTVKTFFQAFLATMIYELSGDSNNLCVLKPVVLGAISAGICAVMNMVLAELKDDYY